MPIILSKDDFEGGKYSIPDAEGVYTDDNVQEAIDNYEVVYIRKLLGVTTGDLFIAWLAASQLPANTDYTKILNAFAEDNTTWYRGIIQSLGMSEYLKAGVFSEYVKNGLVNSQAGVVNTDTETAVKASAASAMRFAENKFNDVLDTVEAIQWYCRTNSEAFPDYNGQEIRVKAAGIL